MKKLYTILALMLLLAGSSRLCGQKAVEYPSLPNEGAAINDFVPKGWRILAITYGDLNKDNVEDVAVVLQNQDEQYIVKRGKDDEQAEYDTNPRILMILFKKSKGGYSLASYSNTFILRNNNLDRIDPFCGIAIYNGILLIDFHIYYPNTSKDITTATHKFRYQNEAFERVGAEIFNITPASGVMTCYSLNFMTRKLCVSKGKTTDKSTDFAEEWVSFKFDKLSNFGNCRYPFATPIAEIIIDGQPLNV